MSNPYKGIRKRWVSQVKSRLLQYRWLARSLGMVVDHSATREWMRQQGLNHDYFIPILPAETVQLKQPKTIEPEPWSVFELQDIELNEVFLARIPSGGYISKYSSCYTNDGVLLEDLSLEFSKTGDLTGFDHSVFSKPVPKPKRIEGRVAIVDTDGAYNYFHWFINILPKLYLLEEAKIQPDFYLIATDKPFQTQSLTFLGIPQHKIIPCTPESHIRADEIILSPLPSSPGILNPASLTFLRGKFNEPKSTRNRIYISRKGAVNGRNIVNEEEVSDLLNSYGFTSHVLERLTLSEQVRLFAEAEVIVAPHGAGLTNMIFCSDKAKIIEIFNPQYHALCYWLLASLMELDYHYLMGEGERASVSDNSYDCTGNILIDINKLEHTLKLAEIGVS